MLPKKLIRDDPALAASKTRNTTEKTTVKIAPTGLRQKESCS